MSIGNYSGGETRILWILGLFLIFYSFLISYKFFTFSYWDWDLAYCSQGMWELTQGRFFVPLLGIKFFEHSHFVFFLLLPFYFLFKHPLFLLFTKVFAFGASGYFFYAYCRLRLNESWSLIWCVFYLIFPANFFSMTYEFAVEAYTPVVLMMMIYFYEKDQFKYFVISSIVLCLIKESMPLILLMFGIHSLWVKGDTKKWALFGIIVGFLAFILLSMFVVPWVGGTQRHDFWIRYSQWGTTPLQVIKAILNPITLGTVLMDPLNRHYFLDLFGPLLIFVLLRPSYIVIIIPILLQHLFSNHHPEHTIFYHYGHSLTPFIFASATSGFAYVYNRSRPLVLKMVIIAFFAAQILFILKWSPDMYWRINIHHDNLYQQRWALIKSIPDNVGVIASFNFLAALSQRHDLYSFHKIYDDYYQDPHYVQKIPGPGKIFELPAPVHYALIDFQDSWLRQALSRNP